jgi:hypothetical protein
VRNDDQDSGSRGGLGDSLVAERGAVDDVKQPGIRTHSRLKPAMGKKDAVPNTRPNARRNTRQIPGEIPGQMPNVELMTGDGGFDQSTGWEDLWRIEKDGNNYRWRLRFTTDRRSRPGGKITPAIRRKLKRRPGKGRHLASRKVAERLRRRAELVAERIRASDLRGALGKDDATRVNGRKNARPHDSALEREQMPGLRELDNWPEMSDVLM